jgi:protein tyrosine phosphatase (PTP) superfamily phosphohydrolase (DUF442 family)
MRTLPLCFAIALASGGFAQHPAATQAPLAQPSSPSTPKPPTLDSEKPVDLPGVHNLVAFGPNFYSGSVPEGDAGFDSLKALGIKTIISVDGAAPDVAAAKARGMRYIHLPIGYNGMDQARTMEIARAVELAENRGPVFLHCHHGKHRSAGAAGAAAVTLGLLSNEAALARLKISGTAPNYKGLFKCVSVARPATQAELAAVPDNFPEVWKTSGLVNTMVEIDEVFDHLKAIEKAGWVSPPDHPDLVPAAEAGRLADLFRNLKDDERVKAESAEFRAAIAAASKEAEEVEAALTATNAANAAARATAKFKIVAQSCKDCHAKHRD